MFKEIFWWYFVKKGWFFYWNFFVKKKNGYYWCGIGRNFVMDMWVLMVKLKFI